MKFNAVALICFCIFAACNSQKDDGNSGLRRFRQACLNESGADEAKVVELLKNKTWSTDDEKVNCYAKCVLYKTGNIDTEGNLFTEKIKANIRRVKALPEDQVDPVIDKCDELDKMGKTPCEKAGLLSKCFFDNGVTLKVAQGGT